MSPLRARLGRALAAVCAVALAAAGCGVPRDDEALKVVGNQVPDDFRPGATVAVPSTVLPGSTTVTSTVYLLKDGRLAPVVRTIAGGSGRSAAELVVDELLKGPTPDEAAQGYTSALDRVRSSTTCDDQPAVDRRPVVIVRGGTASLQLPTGFQGAPETQVVALAQLVYSVTGLAGVGRVVFLCNASPIDVFRADGSIVQTVAREDFCEPGSADVRYRTLCPLPGADVTVFLLRDGRLAHVIRSIPMNPDRPQSELLIDELLKGPTAEEAAAGFSSALPDVLGDTPCAATGTSSSISAAGATSQVSVRGGTASIDLGRRLSGGNEKLVAAVAQLVFTATTLPGIGRVRVVCGGTPTDVLRGDGAIVQGFDSVTREDYCDPASSDDQLRALCPSGSSTDVLP